MNYFGWRHPETEIKTYFITSPASIIEPLELENETNNYKGFRVFTSHDTNKFLRKHIATDCPMIEEWYGDIVSTLEKEILSWSRIFFRTRPSNWSFNVQGRRMTRYPWESIQDDRPIFSVFPDLPDRLRTALTV